MYDRITVCVPSVPECETGEVRLVGGVTNSSGRLEVCGNGVWGTVCNVLNDWGPENAGVVCHQLGFPVTGKTTFVCCHHGGDCTFVSDGCSFS